MLYSFRNWIQLFPSNFPPLRSQALNMHAKSLLFSPINCCKCITFAASTALVNFTSNTTSHKAGESLSWIAFNRCPNASRHWTMDGISNMEGSCQCFCVTWFACTNENEDWKRAEDYAFNFVQASYHPASSYSSIRCRSSGNLSWLIELRDDILLAKCTWLLNFWENKNDTFER